MIFARFFRRRERTAIREAEVSQAFPWQHEAPWDLHSAGQHPYQLFLAAACVLNGATLLAGGPAPKSLEDLLPQWTLVFWGVATMAAGLFLIAGAAWTRRYRGMWIELVGHAEVLLCVPVYAAALVIVNGTTAAAPAALILAFGLASGVRAVQVWRDLVKARAAVREIRRLLIGAS